MSGNLDDSQTSNSSNACIPLNVDSEVLLESQNMILKPKISKQNMVHEVICPSIIKSPSSRIVHVMSNDCMTPSVNREPVFASTDIRFRQKKIGDDKLSNLSQLGEDNMEILKHRRPIQPKRPMKLQSSSQHTLSTYAVAAPTNEKSCF